MIGIRQDSVCSADVELNSFLRPGDRGLAVQQRIFSSADWTELSPRLSSFTFDLIILDDKVIYRTYFHVMLPSSVLAQIRLHEGSAVSPFGPQEYAGDLCR
jgi:hypothetical protein